MQYQTPTAYPHPEQPWPKNKHEVDIGKHTTFVYPTLVNDLGKETHNQNSFIQPDLQQPNLQSKHERKIEKHTSIVYPNLVENKLGEKKQISNVKPNLELPSWLKNERSEEKEKQKSCLESKQELPSWLKNERSNEIEEQTSLIDPESEKPCLTKGDEMDPDLELPWIEKKRGGRSVYIRQRIQQLKDLLDSDAPMSREECYDINKELHELEQERRERYKKNRKLKKEENKKRLEQYSLENKRKENETNPDLELPWAQGNYAVRQVYIRKRIGQLQELKNSVEPLNLYDYEAINKEIHELEVEQKEINKNNENIKKSMKKLPAQQPRLENEQEVLEKKRAGRIVYIRRRIEQLKHLINSGTPMSVDEYDKINKEIYELELERKERYKRNRQLKAVREKLIKNENEEMIVNELES